MHEPPRQQHADAASSSSSSSSTMSQSLDWWLTASAVNAMVEEVLRNSKAVRRLMQAMQEEGCPVSRSYFKVLQCDTKTCGGFSIEHGVVLCHNQLQSYSDVENTMAHELVHAYDYCRLPGMDFKNCEQHACSEVRAANLSGDCSFKQELLRGNLPMTQPSSWAGYKERCVQRKAALSVALNPGCGGATGACAAVQGVFARCMNDRLPFEKT